MNKASQPNFLDSDFFGSSYWMNYHLKVIRRKHVLTSEENFIILKSRLKYYLISTLGFMGFLVSIVYYYRYSSRLDYFSSKLQYSETFKYYALGLGSLYITYLWAEKSYCKNLKFIIMKYGELQEDQYNEFELNKSILNSYIKSN